MEHKNYKNWKIQINTSIDVTVDAVFLKLNCCLKPDCGPDSWGIAPLSLDTHGSACCRKLPQAPLVKHVEKCHFDSALGPHLTFIWHRCTSLTLSPPPNFPGQARIINIEPLDTRVTTNTKCQGGVAGGALPDNSEHIISQRHISGS